MPSSGSRALIFAALAWGRSEAFGLASATNAAETLDRLQWRPAAEGGPVFPVFLAEPGADGAEESEPTLAPTQEPGLRIASDAKDYAWAAAGDASVARAVTSNLRAAAAQKTAAGWATKADGVVARLGDLAPEAAATEAKAEENLKKAKETKKKVQEAIKGAEEKAYAAARGAAEAQVATLEQEGSAYMQSLMQELKALGNPVADPVGEALAKAQQPYMDLENRAKLMVTQYMEQSDEMVAKARGLVGTAMSKARQAQFEQASGFTAEAQRDIMQAHATIGVANEAKRRAENLHHLAEQINLAVPSYNQATQMAMDHTMATVR